jgi:hypothetical protein
MALVPNISPVQEEKWTSFGVAKQPKDKAEKPSSSTIKDIMRWFIFILPHCLRGLQADYYLL